VIDPGSALGGYRPLPPGARWIATAVFLALLCMVAWLERLQYRLRDEEPARWWASNGRDVVNVFALAMMTVGLKVLGFDGPLAFGIAASFVILLSACQGELAHHPGTGMGPGVRSVLAALVLGAPILLVPAQLAAGYRALVLTLFG
jgi:hypothetical protein